MKKISFLILGITSFSATCMAGIFGGEGSCPPSIYKCVHPNGDKMVSVKANYSSNLVGAFVSALGECNVDNAELANAQLACFNNGGTDFVLVKATSVHG